MPARPKGQKDKGEHAGEKPDRAKESREFRREIQSGRNVRDERYDGVDGDVGEWIRDPGHLQENGALRMRLVQVACDFDGGSAKFFPDRFEREDQDELKQVD